jgi:medium-chain acyl-[acyl-carrier-protein] hydrolase
VHSDLGGYVRELEESLRAPHLQVHEPPLHVLPNAEFRTSIVAMGGIPEDFLDDEDLWELVEPCLRADIFAMETYAYAPGPDVRCPLHVFCGSADSIASPPELAAWRARTTGSFSLTMLEGGHFFPQERPAEIVRAVLAALPSA